MRNLCHNLQLASYGASLVLIGSVPGLSVELTDSPLGSINRLIGGLVCLLWLLAVVAAGRLRRPHVFHFVAAAFAVWYVLSLWWSVAPDESPFLMGVVQGALLTGILWDIYRTKHRVETAMQAFLLGGYISVATTLWNYAQGHQARQWEQRFAGTGFDPNDIALLLAIGIPMAAYLARRPNGSRILRWLNVFYPVATGLIIIVSGSRGALLAATPAYIFFLVTVAGLGRWWRIGTIVVLLGAGLALTRMDLSQPLERLGSVTGSASSDHLSGRAELWHAGWAAFAEHPWLGVGGGAFAAATRSRSGLGKSLIAHDTYLSVLTELGPVGLLLLVSVIALVIRATLRQPAPMRVASLLCLLVWGIGVSALSWEFRSQTWLLFGLLVAGGYCGDAQAVHPAAAASRTRPHPVPIRGAAPL